MEEERLLRELLTFDAIQLLDKLERRHNRELKKMQEQIDRLKEDK